VEVVPSLIEFFTLSALFSSIATINQYSDLAFHGGMVIEKEINTPDF
jgi:hypothetical protein